MVNYAELLRKVLRGTRYTAATRDGIYKRARTVLWTELRNAKLPQSEMTVQRLLLEDAIREVERTTLGSTDVGTQALARAADQLK